LYGAADDTQSKLYEIFLVPQLLVWRGLASHLSCTCKP